MENEGIVLNLHGEVPSSPADNVTVMNAEMRFLPVLRDLAGKYPRLKIVLEHCTSADAIEAVKSLGENVTGTIVCTLGYHKNHTC
jgi:dihydroorotase